MKALIEQSYEMGKKAYGKFNSAPHNNSEFMATVPNCPMGDDKGCKLRIKMYNAYMNGWTLKSLRPNEE